jgi:myo-inositol 2-dehydrogenase/D-chiro-inositol 1-dehydrogenase
LAAIAGVEVTIVMDADPARAARLASSFGARTVEDAGALIASGAIDAVVVASPNETHPELVEAAIAAGKHVLCEKPLALGAGEARRVVAREAEAGRRLVQVGFMRRYDPRHASLAGLLHAGRAGQIALVRVWHHSVAGNFTMSVDHALRSAMVHDFDALAWLAAGPPRAVSAVTVRAGPPEGGWDADFIHVRCRFGDGALGVVEFHAKSAAGYAVGAEVAGSAGTLTMAASPAPVLRTASGATQAADPDWFARFDDAYRLQAAAWVAAVRGDGPPGPGAPEGLASLLVAEAALASLAAGGAVVPVGAGE